MGVMFQPTRVKQRVCLKCDKSFQSIGPGNRICAKCRRANKWLLLRPESLVQRERGRKYHNGELLDVDPEY